MKDKTIIKRGAHDAKWVVILILVASFLFAGEPDIHEALINLIQSWADK